MNEKPETVSNEEVINLSEKMDEIRAVQAEEEMKKLYGDKIKPLTVEQSSTMGQWGSKKRIRYGELLDLGKDTVEAYEIVEHNKGVIPLDLI